MINLLWTGGWDSTYRLIDLTLIKKVVVQPTYVIDETRLSTGFEFEAQDRIRNTLHRLSPEAAARILDTKVVDRRTVPDDPVISADYERLKQRFYIGPQYEWLARAAKFLDLENLELSIHRDDRWFAHLDGHVERVGDVWKVSPGARPDLLFLRRFSFPLLMMTKLEMERKASEGGFLPILEQTWFCHSPLNSRPCGRCGPCQFTIKEGLGRRLPWQWRARAALLRPIKLARRGLRAIIHRGTALHG